MTEIRRTPCTIEGDIEMRLDVVRSHGKTIVHLMSPDYQEVAFDMERRGLVSCQQGEGRFAGVLEVQCRRRRPRAEGHAA